jgi:hypothetical protein
MSRQISSAADTRGQRAEILRPAEDPKLALGDTVMIKDGISGIVLAAYKPKSAPGMIGYIVERTRVNPNG